MNAKLLGFIAVTVPAVALLALACGGDGGGDEEAAIRVEKGLAAAGAATDVGFGGDAGGAEPGGAFGEVPIAQPAPVFGEEIASAKGRPEPAFAPLSFPLLQQGQTGINVQGFGSATVPATTARLQLFVVGGDGFYPEPIPPPPPFGEEPSEPFPERQTLGEEDLAPIVEAIEDQGIAKSDIEVNLNPDGYYDPYGPGRARITVSMSDPQGRVQPVTDAARDAASASGTLFLESVNVLYSVSPEVCATLERESMVAAVEDARNRAQLLAQVLGVGIGDVVFASHYSYSPFGPSPCDPAALAYPEFYGGYYDPTRPAEATLTSNVTVTYAIQ